eukprot:EG_transcript_12401
MLSSPRCLTSMEKSKPKAVTWNPPARLNVISFPTLPVVDNLPHPLPPIQDYLSPSCLDSAPSPSWERLDGRGSFSTTSSFDVLDVCSQVSQVCSSSTYEVVECDVNSTPSYSEVGSTCNSPRTPRDQDPSARFLQRVQMSHIAFGRQYVPGCAVAKLQRSAVFMTPATAARRGKAMKLALNSKSLESKLWRAVVESREPAADMSALEPPSESAGQQVDDGQAAHIDL